MNEPRRESQLVYLLRHAIERMVSNWRQSLADGLGLLDPAVSSRPVNAGPLPS